MAGDPNARRDKALEAIAGELGKHTALLRKIEVNTRPTKLVFRNTPETARGGSDDAQPGPYGVGPHPYE